MNEIDVSQMYGIDVTDAFDSAMKASRYCVRAAADLIALADPKFVAPPQALEYTLAKHVAVLATRIAFVEGILHLVIGDAINTRTTRPEPFGGVSGDSFHEIGVRFAEQTFDSLQKAYGLTPWQIPFPHVTKKQIQERAILIGRQAETVLPLLWKSAPRLDSHRLCRCIENEAARVAIAYRAETAQRAAVEAGKQ